MASVAFSTASSSVSFLNGDLLDYSTAASVGYCTSYKVGGRMNFIVAVYSPGESGAGTQNFGGGGQTIHLGLCYVDDTEMNCTIQFDNDMQVLAAGTFSMTVGAASTFQGCYLASEPQAEQPRSTGYGTYRMDANLSIRCVRP